MNYKEYKQQLKEEFEAYKEKIKAKLDEFKEKQNLKLEKFKLKTKNNKKKSKSKSKRRTKGGTLTLDDKAELEDFLKILIPDFTQKQIRDNFSEFNTGILDIEQLKSNFNDYYKELFSKKSSAFNTVGGNIFKDNFITQNNYDSNKADLTKAVENVITSKMDNVDPIKLNPGKKQGVIDELVNIIISLLDNIKNRENIVGITEQAQNFSRFRNLFLPANMPEPTKPEPTKSKSIESKFVSNLRNTQRLLQKSDESDFVDILEQPMPSRLTPMISTSSNTPLFKKLSEDDISKRFQEHRLRNQKIREDNILKEGNSRVARQLQEAQLEAARQEAAQQEAAQQEAAQQEAARQEKIMSKLADEAAEEVAQEVAKEVAKDAAHEAFQEVAQEAAQEAARQEAAQKKKSMELEAKKLAQKALTNKKFFCGKCIPKRKGEIISFS